jgi:signal transduction histidine kinase
MARYPISGSGLVIAVIGFGLTRFTVTLAAMETIEQFLFTGIVPLVMGLSLSAFGVVLAVGAYDTHLVRTTALWCLLGTGSMAVLAGLTVLGTGSSMLTDPETIRRQAYLSTFLIGGAVGGTLTGLYSARSRRQQTDLRQQANRLVTLNRLLRDQVINSALAIKGHADVLEAEYNDDSVDVVGRQADTIIDIVENVKYLSGTADKSDISLVPIDLVGCIETESEAVADDHPDATLTLDVPDESVEVTANSQLHEVFGHLIENAVTYSEDPDVNIAVEHTHRIATVRISDNGPGLPDAQQALLETGQIAEFDDPTTGFGLNIARLLTESFDGTIETTVTSEGTTIEIRFPRSGNANGLDSTTGLGVTGVSSPRVALAVGVGIISGVTMAVAMVLTGFGLDVIGALYGIDQFGVAVITHEFHSIVFALMYATVLVMVPDDSGTKIGVRLGLGAVFGLSLWLVAAGIIMPLWLRLVGLGATLPNITLPSLVGHSVWGLTTGLVYHFGDSWLANRE